MLTNIAAYLYILHIKNVAKEIYVAYKLYCLNINTLTYLPCVELTQIRADKL